MTFRASISLGNSSGKPSGIVFMLASVRKVFETPKVPRRREDRPFVVLRGVEEVEEGFRGEGEGVEYAAAVAGL